MKTSELRSLRAKAAALGASAWTAVAAAVIAMIVLLVFIPSLIAAFLAPLPRVPQAGGASSVDQGSKYGDYLAQYDGRSLFFIPSPPTPIVSDVPRERPTPAPTQPTRYGGPSIIALINDTAWFSDGRRLAAGGEKDGSLRVVRVEAPWNAVVEWQGVEFTVSLFDRDQVVLKDKSASPAESSTAEPQAAASNPPDPDESAQAQTDDRPESAPETATADAPPQGDVTPNGQGDTPERDQP